MKYELSCTREPPHHAWICKMAKPPLIIMSLHVLESKVDSLQQYFADRDRFPPEEMFKLEPVDGAVSYPDGTLVSCPCKAWPTNDWPKKMMSSVCHCIKHMHEVAKEPHPALIYSMAGCKVTNKSCICHQRGRMQTDDNLRDMHLTSEGIHAYSN